MIKLIDDYYLVISLILCCGWNLSFYAIAACCKFDKVTDLAYGTNFILVSIITLVLSETYFIRQIVVSVLVCVWAIRLVVYLVFRINIIGEDKRFDEYRAYPLRFLRFWIFQMISIWVIILPEIFLNSKQYDINLNWRDYLGWITFTVGLLCETIADYQKFCFRIDSQNANHWCDVGLWRYSRHPNYFGEILLWYGLFISCSSVFKGADFATIVGPTYLALILMFLSGVPKLEKSAIKQYWNNGEYRAYRRNTSVLVPLPHGCIVNPCIRTWLFCEYPMYGPPTDTTTAMLQNESYSASF